MNKKSNVLGNSATVSIGGLAVGTAAHRAYGSGSGSRKYLDHHIEANFLQLIDHQVQVTEVWQWVPLLEGLGAQQLWVVLEW